MKVRKLGHDSLRKSIALLIGVVLALGGSPAVFAQSSAAVAGVILDPSGQPASGFKVVLRDEGSGKLFTSEPTDAQGNYSANVPVGGRYKLDHVVASDGVTKLAVQDVPPVSVLAAGTTRLNVHFTNAPATSAVAASAPPSDADKKKSAVPWYKRPGPIVGMVLGSAAVLALIIGGGGGSSNNNASPTTP